MSDSTPVLEVVIAPVGEPISLALARQHLRCFSSDTSENTYIEALIAMAREWVEDYTGRACIDQTLRQTVIKSHPLATDSVSEPSTSTVLWTPSNGIRLLRSPVIGIESVKSVSSEGTETEIAAETYEVREPDSRWPLLLPKNGAVWNDSVLRIVYRAGFVDLAASPEETPETKVPKAIIQSMLLIISNFYDNREPVNIGNIVNQLPMGIEWLLRSQKAPLGIR